MAVLRKNASDAKFYYLNIGDMRETNETPNIGRYAIEGTLGSGGMGTVYLAHHEILDRPVALKVPKPELASNEVFVQRFLREARALGTLNHANIVAVYDAGIERDIPYIAMEYIAGDTLNDRILELGQIDVAHVAHWGDQMARALAYLHDQQIFHRDLKSANVIINERGDAIIADFGIAQIEPDSNLTRGVLGTPSYMSPEQAMGKPLDARSDLYSLGIILYECLTGTVPFRDDNSYALVQKVIHEAPPPIKKVRPDAPDWICRLVSQCLKKDPDARFPDGHALLKAFELEDAKPLYAHYLNSRPIPKALPPKSATRNSRGLKKTRSSRESYPSASAPTLVEDHSQTVTMYAPALPGPVKPGQEIVADKADAQAQTIAEPVEFVAPLPAKRRTRGLLKPFTVLVVSAVFVAIAVAPFTQFAPFGASSKNPFKESPSNRFASSAASEIPAYGQLEDTAAQSATRVIPESTFVARETISITSADSSGIETTQPTLKKSEIITSPLTPGLDLSALPVAIPDSDIAGQFESNILDSFDIDLDLDSLGEMMAENMEMSAPKTEAKQSEDLAARVPQLINELAMLKTQAQLEKILRDMILAELVLFGDRHSVREPDLAFIFLTNTENGKIRSLLVPTQEGWVDYYSGNIITEENGRFYERAPDASSALKWWLHNVSPTWVEPTQQELMLDENGKKRVGW